MTLSHFTAALLFALCTSTVFGITGKSTDRERLLYGIWVFALFLLITVGAAWLMYFLRR
ncbi:MAG: hypothetical protein HY648_03160 [Acidobacteria bacterium]|nr:hypothetical protein [Acidobacteriota bacterium]